MNKVVKQENELNLVIGARKVVRKFGPRKLALVLSISSMLGMTACGKKEERVQTESNVTLETYEDATPKYRDRPLGGSIVDNHNKELYIDKASDLEAVVEGTQKENTASNKKSSSNTQSSSQKTNTTNNVVNNNTSVPTTSTNPTTPQGSVVEVPEENVPAPDLMPGESVTYSPDGSYVVTPSQDYVNPPQPETPQEPGQPSTPEPPVVEDPPVEDETPPVEEQSQGYVVQKLNYSDNVYFYTFTDTGAGYEVMLTPIEYANINNINSHILALADDDKALNYALAEGWTKVGLYNSETYDFLDSVYNIEEELDNRVAAALELKNQADQQNIEEETQSLTLTPES